MHLVGLEPTTSPSTLLLQREEVLFELELNGNDEIHSYDKELVKFSSYDREIWSSYVQTINMEIHSRHALIPFSCEKKGSWTWSSWTTDFKIWRKKTSVRLILHKDNLALNDTSVKNLKLTFTVSEPLSKTSFCHSFSSCFKELPSGIKFKLLYFLQKALELIDSNKADARRLYKGYGGTPSKDSA